MKIEDGDIGYAGTTHLSFVGQRVAAVQGPATHAGSASAAALVAFVRARFHGPATPEDRGLKVTPDAYWSAISRIARGVA